MSEKPINFSPEMAQAVYGGRKTQTRWIVKPQPKPGFELYHFDGYHAEFRHQDFRGANFWPYEVIKPRYQVGERLWGREPWGSVQADHPKCLNGRKPQRLR